MITLMVSSGVLDHKELPRQVQFMYHVEDGSSSAATFSCDWCGFPFQQPHFVRCSNCRCRLAESTLFQRPPQYMGGQRVSHGAGPPAFGTVAGVPYSCYRRMMMTS